jgi:magnesium-transporting ATPase (P-type)
VIAEAERLSAEGFRVLALAEGPVGLDAALNNTDLSCLTLLGFACMIDPLRPEAKPAVKRCQSAGIQVVMVTGDHPATSLAISRQLGLADSEGDVVTGQALELLGGPNNPRFAHQVRSSRVFARVNPLQKLEIVDSLIRAGQFVAVTGDGVNDAPALRRANIGVAMGSGTDVAKDTASILITDDNFATLEAGVEEGRFAYNNIRRVIFFLISNGAAELTFFLLSVVTLLPLPLVPTQILWVNLITSGLQDIGLAFEKGNPDAMRRPPRQPSESIFNRQMIQQTAVAGLTMGLVCFGTWVWLLNQGWEESAGRNIILLLLISLETYNAFNARSERRSAFRVPVWNNYFLVGGIILANLVHLMAMNTPLFQDVLQTQPVPLQQWLILFAMGSSVLVTMELFKFYKRRVDPLRKQDFAPPSP